MANKWVRIEDRLPDKEGFYLVANCKSKYVGMAKYCFFDPEYNPNNRFAIESIDIYRSAGFYEPNGDGSYYKLNDYEDDEITHWMSPPEAPNN